jgi:sulfite reductase (ferredoxin)
MTIGYYQLPPDLAADIDTYEGEVRRFLAGDLPASVLKARRVPRGVYEQRQDGTFMVRVRVAGGTLNSAQALELATLSREFGNGLVHVTTRQDVQFHDVLIENTPTVMRRLMTVGLTSKGGGGNTVRNIAACPYAGICPAERFDVTPCAYAVTEYLIPLVGSYNLPRKYKIAFSGCGADCALAQVADLGFIAEVRAGQPGFRVLAGGGMGAQSRIADILLDWTPTTEIIRVAETVRRLFDQLGDRTNRNRARLRFVFNRIGVDEFRRLFATRLAEVIREGVPPWTGSPFVADPHTDRRPIPPSAEIQTGIRVIPQRQKNLVVVPLHLPLGFLPASDLARIGELAARFSRESGLRTTRAQNLLIRSVPVKDLPALVAGLRSLETDVLSPTPLDRFIACAGASTCRLGICLARSAARVCAHALAESGVARETLDAMDFYLNGCSNACGQQPVGPIGLFGAAQRSGGRLIPSYHITLGGRCAADGARFGTPVGKVAARALPDWVRDLAADFESGRTPGESFIAYFDRRGLAHFETMVARHESLPDFETRPDFYRDWDASEDFSLAGRGAGECGAGVFEVIRQDLAVARSAVAPFDILLPTARALLITRGVDAQDPDTVLREFERYFIETGLVAEEFRTLLTRARGFTQGWKTALDEQTALIVRLRDRVELLFSTLDASLEFHPPDAPKGSPAPVSAASGGTPHTPVPCEVTAELNLRGVPCPMNFVKARLKLESLQLGDTLALILDDGDPIRNVPESFKNEGQEVGESTNLNDGHWRVVVTKKQ